MVGFDDVPAASNFDPPLTTVSQSIEKLGRKAVKLLDQFMHQPASIDNNHGEVLETKLIIRDLLSTQTEGGDNF